MSQSTVPAPLPPTTAPAPSTPPARRAKRRSASTRLPTPAPPQGDAVDTEPVVDDTALPADLALDDPVRGYLVEIARTPLLSAAEEIALAQQIAWGREAAIQLQQGQIDSAAGRTLQALLDDAQAARHHLTQANLRLVVSIAKKYVGGQLSLLDLIQEGNLGLMRAVEKFDHRKGHRFSTYATWWIRQGITRAIAEQGRTVRLPIHMSERIAGVWRTTHQLQNTLQRPPTVEEIAEAMGLSADQVRDAQQAAPNSLSLDMPISEDSDTCLGERIADDQSTEEIATHTVLREQLLAAVARLPAREAEIIRLRYGLVDGRYRTLEEVGQVFGVSRERIRQIEAGALRKLRHPAFAGRLRGA